LYAAEDVIIAPGETVAVPVGFAVELPDGYELQIRPRSGISLKTKLRVANAPGTIDADYRGEVAVIVDNIFEKIDEPFSFRTPRYWLTADGNFVDISHMTIDEYLPRTYIVRQGDRIAQAAVVPIPR